MDYCWSSRFRSCRRKAEGNRKGDLYGRSADFRTCPCSAGHQCDRQRADLLHRNTPCGTSPRSVLAVLTHKSGMKLCEGSSRDYLGQPADRALQLLQDDRIFYGNQPIAVAVARNLEAACEAAERVRVRV